MSHHFIMIASSHRCGSVYSIDALLYRCVLRPMHWQEQLEVVGKRYKYPCLTVYGQW